MRIAAALCWYDEPLEHLQRVVASVAQVADCIVAFDGAWLGFPHDKARSKPSQVRALREAAAVHGLDLGETPSRFRGAWLSQAVKRTMLYREASTRADWVLVIDADCELMVDDPAFFRQHLMKIDTQKRPDAINMRIATPGPRNAGGKDTATAPHGVRWQPRLLRADQTITVGPFSHRTIVTDEAVIQMENADDRALHLHRRAGRIATIHGASIINHTHSRSAERIADKLAYGKARAERGID